MIAWSPDAGAWLLQQAATLSDTVLVRQISEPRSWFDTVSAIASILISLALLALCVGLIPAAWNFRKSYKKVNELLDRIYGDVTPIVQHTHAIVDNVNYVSAAVRTDVAQVSETVAAANERLRQAVRLAERRMNEFNALLDVVQREAESTFVATAATVRGVRRGAAAFRHGSARGELAELAALAEELRRTPGAFADLEDRDELEDFEELDDLDELDDAGESLDIDSGADVGYQADIGTMDDLEPGDATDGSRERGRPDGPERPRIRRRGKPRGHS